MSVAKRFSFRICSGGQFTTKGTESIIIKNFNDSNDVLFQTHVPMRSLVIYKRFLSDHFRRLGPNKLRDNVNHRQYNDNAQCCYVLAGLLFFSCFPPSFFLALSLSYSVVSQHSSVVCLQAEVLFLGLSSVPVLH